jgi:hypothetical protein
MSHTDFNPEHFANVGVTGCLDAQTEKVQGKAVNPRQPASLSRIEKQKEKVLIFLPTILLSSLLVSTAWASTVITPAGTPPANPWNPFYYTNITITSNSPTYNAQSNIKDMFGGTFSTLEAPGRVIFGDQPGQVTYDVFFTTNSPATLNGYSLFLTEDAGTLNRSATNFELLANGNVISNVALASKGSSYAVSFGSDSIDVSASFAPVTATTFEAIFTSNIGFNNGVRILGFQAATQSGGQVTGNPEPSTISLALLAILAFTALYRRRMAR